MKMAVRNNFLKMDFTILKFVIAFTFTILTVGSLYFLSNGNIIAALAVISLPIPVYLLYLIFKFPRLGLITSFFCNYFAIGFTRYIPAPLGLMVDGALLLTLIALLFQSV